MSEPLKGYFTIRNLRFVLSLFMFGWLCWYFYTGFGGPSELVAALVPIALMLQILSLHEPGYIYKRLPPIVNSVLVVIYLAVCVFAFYHFVTQYEEIAIWRQGSYTRTDFIMGLLVFLLVLELSRIVHTDLFWVNVVMVVYTLWGHLSPIDFFWHPGTSFYRVVTSSTVELSTGMIVGCIYQSGLGVRFTSVMVAISGGSVVVTLVACALAALVLGMGMPISPAYILLVALIIPALTLEGVNIVAAHLFAIYFCRASLVTPPVAISAYVAAGIAGAPMAKTGWTAFRLGISSFLVPFAFVYSQALLLMGPLLLATGAMALIWLRHRRDDILLVRHQVRIVMPFGNRRQKTGQPPGRHQLGTQGAVVEAEDGRLPVVQGH